MNNNAVSIGDNSMKQTIIALLSVMGATRIAYSGREGKLYFTNKEAQYGVWVWVNTVTFYRLAKGFGIQSPTAFALANGTNLVKGK